ncbi:HTH-type transcriptional repressor KstR2 [Corynebacterium kalinowskii]|uniref:HTH-type transcriptional repressor KstR2 n=1 Tax=Corynebacterium kalinowskii TaxID=2675216 RepID=A0A6B8VDB6_9CORY|nr:TetR/AcrR family transcriptional regulator [Corynebacterium kalinowskii]QGU03212.1 HTH-type transcriptional repressor KstR2 [Corynebacterium kalinowskii]
MTVKQGRPGYNREDILRIAVQEFNAHGYEATSMGDLAKVLGLSKSAIYHHISSKEDLLKSATDKALTLLDSVVAECEESEASAIERLHILVRGTTAALCAEAQYVTLLIRLRGNSEVELAALARRREFTNYLVSLVAEAQGEGALRSEVDSAVAGRLLFGMINSLVEWYVPGGRLDSDQVANIVEVMVFKGLQL